MEKMGLVNSFFWKDKKVFLTGHTGFKGSWLSIWLHSMGAKVTGYSLNPPTEPSLFSLCQIDNLIEKSIVGDIRDYEKLKQSVSQAAPEIIIHMAAQPLVRESYKDPIETYSTNVMGTVHLFEAVRSCSSVKAVLNVTTDKCYDNKEWVWGYREDEPLGGYDPYSSSKACSELVTSAFRSSYFSKETYADHQVALASARAGNVIGGGDWAKDRLIPDIIKSITTNERILIRNPNSIRPWQHVLEPLSGYLLLCQNLYENGTTYADSWNFGPNDEDAKPVEWIVNKICQKWDGYNLGYEVDRANQPHEAHYLKLDCSKAKQLLHWHPRWSLDKTLDKIVEWTKAYESASDMYKICCDQIMEYQNS
ncbi:CDP-glucose 4,6-dehydratase [Paenibacillus sp. GCM10023248]|uniref:CDP-glucose 4,6-dehydratase n=1 Tax=unclassified Paenibacillus TaxID=185978 RepID=UPI0023797C96|nr:CDP-glucose 4,6-dehydratase [Paenibacillus sp. MAHUQ-63]MDD9266607.1 CDP-glucose 4,6-dehydratase [Paenibacillus sp. MAHUQ-63]